jgi:hypothetical protein
MAGRKPIKMRHRGAGEIALRMLGEDTPTTRNIVYKWSRPKERFRPVPIHREGPRGKLFVLEHDVRIAETGEGEFKFDDDVKT